MIKFFRKIRQKLLTENRFSKYLLYAIGEIILVVIGILIALQINEWNNQNKRNKLEKVLLSEINDEIDKVYQDAVQDLQVLKFGQRSYGRIMSYIINDTKYADSMALDFFWLIRDEYIYPKEAVYEKIKKEGVDIIRNDIIKKSIQDLYEAHFPRIKINNTYYRNLEDFFSPYFQEHFTPNLSFTKDSIVSPTGNLITLPRTFLDIDGKIIMYNLGYIPKDFTSLKSDSKFLILLEQSNRARNFKISRYNQTIEEIEKVKLLIAQEIRK